MSIQLSHGFSLMLTGNKQMGLQTLTFVGTTSPFPFTIVVDQMNMENLLIPLSATSYSLVLPIGKTFDIMDKVTGVPLYVSSVTLTVSEVIDGKYMKKLSQLEYRS